MAEKNDLEKFADGLKKAGDSMSKTGSDLTIGCTIPIIIFIIIMILLLK